MKKTFYKYFRLDVYNRWKLIQLKKDIRRAAIKWSIEYLKEWNHIPISYLVGDICEKLQIQKEASSISFICQLRSGSISQSEAEKIIQLPKNININQK